MKADCLQPCARRSGNVNLCHFGRKHALSLPLKIIQITKLIAISVYFSNRFITASTYKIKGHIYGCTQRDQSHFPTLN